MPRSPTSYDTTDPRRPKEAVPYRFPRSQNGAAGTLSVLAMLCSGAAMITRFPIWTWFGFWFAVASMNSSKSLAPDDNKGMWSGWSCLMFSLTAMMSIYSPILSGQATKAPFGWDALPFKFNGGTIPVVPA